MLGARPRNGKCGPRHITQIYDAESSVRVNIAEYGIKIKKRSGKWYQNQKKERKIDSISDKILTCSVGQSSLLKFLLFSLQVEFQYI